MNFTPLLQSSPKDTNPPLFYCFLQYRDIDSYRSLKRHHKKQLVHDFLESFYQIADLDFTKLRYIGPEQIRQRRSFEIIFDIIDPGIPRDQLFRFHFGLTNHWNYIFHWSSYKDWKQIYEGFGKPAAMLKGLRGRYLNASWCRFHQSGRHSLQNFYDIYKFAILPKKDGGGLDHDLTGSGCANLHPNPDLLPGFWQNYMPWNLGTEVSGMFDENPPHKSPTETKCYNTNEKEEEYGRFSHSRIQL